MPTAHLADRSNQLLDALPAAERDRWFAQLTPTFVEIKTVLFEPGQTIQSVYFPLSAVIALVTPLHGGAMVEVATVGMSHDRVGVDQFAVTHEFLGQLLGSRRATVTLSASLLQEAGLIEYRRGVVTIVDRPGLEAMSCECYGVIRAELDGVLNRAELRGHGVTRWTPHPVRPGPTATPPA